jgi:VanZ family protein
MRWRIASIFLLATVLGLALAPEVWPWNKQFGSNWHLSDKWMHGLTFAALAVWYSGQYARRDYWWFAFGLVIFGALIEACQSMVSYRTAETADLVADALGIGAGILIALTGVGGWSLKLESWLQNRSD